MCASVEREPQIAASVALPAPPPGCPPGYICPQEAPSGLSGNRQDTKTPSVEVVLRRAY